MTDTAYHQIRTGTAAAPAGCPVDHGFSPLMDAYIDDPYPSAAALREDSPVVYAEPLGFVVVSRMDLVTEVFMNPDVYSSENVQDPVFPICDEAASILSADDFDPVAVMSNRQEPDHGRIRNYTKRVFSAKRLQALEPYMRERTHALIDDMIAAGPPTDFVASLAYPLPGEVIFRFLGFPESDDQQLKDWCENRLAFSWGQPTRDEQVAIATNMLAYWRYVREFVAERAARPGDDLASELIGYHRDNPDDLLYREVESIVYGLSFAGHEPVTLLLGNTVMSLLSQRDDWDAVVADPTLLPKAIEEVIRWNSPQIGWRRITTCDTTLGGVDLPAGTPIFLNLGAANRDPRAFDAPDDFDVSRPDAARNISFGKGNHYCLGAKFARFEARVVMEAVVERLPTLALHGEQHPDPFPNISFRGPSHLAITWD
jgi:cytochrome P450